MADLTVDTVVLRQVAAQVRDAVDVLTPNRLDATAPCPLVDASLGASALGREVVSLAERRVRQGLEAADTLSTTARAAAGGLDQAAAAFDDVEATAAEPAVPSRLPAPSSLPAFGPPPAAGPAGPPRPR